MTTHDTSAWRPDYPNRVIIASGKQRRHILMVKAKVAKVKPKVEPIIRDKRTHTVEVSSNQEANGQESSGECQRLC